jgi:hypothetical protein
MEFIVGFEVFVVSSRPLLAGSGQLAVDRIVSLAGTGRSSIEPAKQKSVLLPAEKPVCQL